MRRRERWLFPARTARSRSIPRRSTRARSSARAHCPRPWPESGHVHCGPDGRAFGGKESQAAQPAVIAALVALRTGRPARLVYPRRLDMRITGKRHPYLSRYQAGFSSDGRIDALVLELYSDGGCACDLSLPVMDRSILHADNSYYIPHFSVCGKVCRTNSLRNTAMRVRARRRASPRSRT